MTISSSLRIILFSLSLAVLAGCAGPGGSSGAGNGRAVSGGGYYKDDGPGSNMPTDLEGTPNASPRIEQHSSSNFKPYTAFGRKYVPISDNSAYREVGTASWYGRKFHGRKTANGEIYDMYAMTAAHPTLPIPSYARVTRPGTGKSVIVRINDRGPFHSSRIIDLSYVAASKLGLIAPGSGEVIVEAITNEDIRNGRQAPDVLPDLPQPEAHMLASAAPSPKPSLTMHTVEPDGSKTPPRAIKASGVAKTSGIAQNKASGKALNKIPNQAPAAGSAQDVPDALQALAMAGSDESDAVGKLPSATNTLAQADTLPAEDSRAVPRTVGTRAGSIYLQFGAFSGAQGADELARKLNARISRVETRKARVQPGGNLYKVRIGPYASRTDAVNAANRIQAQTGMNASMALL